MIFQWRLYAPFGHPFWYVSDVQNSKRTKSVVKRVVLWTCKNVPKFTLEPHSCWFLEPSGPPFTKLGYVETDIFVNFRSSFRKQNENYSKKLNCRFGHSRRSSWNVNLTDPVSKLAPSKHDFVNENVFQKAHLGRQGSIQSDLVGQAVSSARMHFSTRWTY